MEFSPTGLWATACDDSGLDELDMTALPLFLWMGEILFRSSSVKTCSGSRAVAEPPARPPVACQRDWLLIFFAAVSGSSADLLLLMSKVTL
jgi:hypothetical protein